MYGLTMIYEHCTWHKVTRNHTPDADLNAVLLLDIRDVAFRIREVVWVEGEGAPEGSSHNLRCDET